MARNTRKEGEVVVLCGRGGEGRIASPPPQKKKRKKEKKKEPTTHTQNNNKETHLILASNYSSEGCEERIYRQSYRERASYRTASLTTGTLDSKPVRKQSPHKLSVEDDTTDAEDKIYNLNNSRYIFCSFYSNKVTAGKKVNRCGPVVRR